MSAFTIRWRSARRHREHEISAAGPVAAALVGALQGGGGFAVWQAGTVWRCPGCGDRTVKTEEFIEGIRRADQYLSELPSTAVDSDGRAGAATAWIEEILTRMLGCERDRVYIKDESGACSYQNESCVSRI